MTSSKESTTKLIKLENMLNKEISNFSNISTIEIAKALNINTKAKNINSMIFKEIIKKSKNFEDISLLIKECNCQIKTVNLEWNDALKESMSLSSFKYMDVVDEEWKTCKLRNYFLNNTFIFVVFKKESKKTVLKNVCIWKMPKTILDKYVSETWNKTKKLLTEGKIVKYIDKRGRYITYFPTASETRYIHVRPHARNAFDVIELPVEDKLTHLKQFTKHSFWLNSGFIRKIIVENKYYE